MDKLEQRAFSGDAQDEIGAAIALLEAERGDWWKKKRRQRNARRSTKAKSKIDAAQIVFATNHIRRYLESQMVVL